MQLPKVRVYRVDPEVIVTEKFKKREMIVIDGEESHYPQHVIVQVSQDKCSLFNDINTGDLLDLECNLRGNLFKRKDGSGEGCMNTIQVWKLTVLEKAKKAVSPAMAKLQAGDDDEDDLPF